MNTYDFDKTIFYPDSSCTFVIYCLQRHPLIVLKALPRTIGAGIKKLCGRADTKYLKERVFSFLKDIKDIDALVEEFWQDNSRRIGDWYLRQKKDDDLIISASPEFLLEPAARLLGVRLIGTRMDKLSGRISGNNCHDAEKPIRFREQYPEGESDEFYSDSLSDSPMAEISKKAFLVKKGKLSPWPGK